MKNIIIISCILSLSGCVTTMNKDSSNIAVYKENSHVLKRCERLGHINIKMNSGLLSDRPLLQAKNKLKQEAYSKYKADALTISKFHESIGEVSMEGVAYLCSNKRTDRKIVKENRSHKNNRVSISIINHSNKKPNILKFNVKSVSETSLTPLRTHKYHSNEHTGKGFSYVSGFIVADNFGNSLNISNITPKYTGDKLRPDEDIVFTILLKDKPIDLTEKLLISVERGIIGNKKDIILEYSLK